MGGYPLYPVDRYESFRDLLRGMKDQYRGREAITVYSRGKEAVTKTYENLSADVGALSRALVKRGWQGRHIGIASENSYEWVVIFFAILTSGNLAVLIDVEQSVGTIRAMIEMADTEVVFASSAVAGLMAREEALRKLPVFAIPEGNQPCGAADYGGLLPQGLEERLDGRVPGGETEPDGPAVIAFTSGTTSVPKPVLLSRSNLLSNAAGSLALVQPGSRIFTSLPLYHTYGLTCSVLNNLQNGAHLCLNGNIKTVFRDLELFQPSTVMAVPLLVEMLHKRLLGTARSANIDGELQPQKRKLFHSSQSASSVLEKLKDQFYEGLSLIICGGAHLPAEISRTMERFGVQVLQGYGITECSPLISVNRNLQNDPDSVGLVLPGCELKFDEGEILVRGEGVMLGYYRDEESTIKSMTGGWFRTGDLGYLDRKGFLHITGRKKNLIVLKNGKKVAPEEIEARLGALPLVKEVLAYGANTGTSADDMKIAVMVYPDPEETKGLAPFEILDRLQKEIDEINGNYPAYKQIQMVHLRETEFLKTSSRKIKRQN